MLKLEGIEKELFPYLKLEYMKISIYSLFNQNIDSIDGCRRYDGHFDMWKYCEIYCKQDFNILKQGFNKFRVGFKMLFDVDIFEFVSVSSITNEVFNQKVYNPNENLHMLGGVAQLFIKSICVITIRKSMCIFM